MPQLQESLKKLNPEQLQAVKTIDGPLLVVAGPGSGKTQLLSLRVANILQEVDINPSNILCLTFTDSASFNMTSRLSQFLGSLAYKVAVHTFHSFGTEIINQNPEYFFHGASYTPADDIAKIELIHSLIQKLPSTNPLSSFHPDFGWTYQSDIISRIKDLKEAGIKPKDFLVDLKQNQPIIKEVNQVFANIFNNFGTKNLEKQTNWQNFVEAINHIYIKNQQNPWLIDFVTEVNKIESELSRQDRFSSKPITTFRGKVARKNSNNDFELKDSLNFEKYLTLSQIYTDYQNLLQTKGFFDFEDMLLEVVTAMQKYPDLKYNLQEQYQYILVDEFQDTNGVQMKLLDLLTDNPANENKPNLMVVGDDDQAIYKFNKASLKNILYFNKKYPETKVITLKTNYRSTQSILDLASSVIQQSDERLTDLLKIKKSLVAHKIET